MVTTPAAASEPQAPINHLGRIVGALFSPKATFEDIAKRPTWIAPLLVLTLIWFALNVVLVRRVDWLQVTRDQIEKNRFAASQIERLEPDKREAAYESGARRGKISRYVRGVIGWPLLTLVFGGIYLGTFKLFGGARINFSQSFALVAHAYVPLGLRELIAIPVSLVKDPSAIDPENFLASNVAAFLPGDAPLWQIALGASADLFGLWALVLIAFAFSAADPKKVTFGKASSIAFGVWAVITLFFTGLAWAFS
jgi:Yip1-like protein